MKEILRTNRLGDLVYLTFPGWELLPAIGHGFSTRLGGFSAGPFSTMNLGFRGGDSPSLVAANRAHFLGTIWGRQEERLLYGEQVHGTQVCVVDRQLIRSKVQTIPQADALVTAEKEVLVGGFSADCLLALFIDLDRRAIGVAHAGWRGTINGILSHVVTVMQGQWHSEPGKIQCLLGPCIQSCCYEIGEEVEETAANSPWSRQIVFREGMRADRRHLDLTDTNRQILQESGIKKEHIFASQYCTCCCEEFFYSYRRVGGQPTGSLMGLIFLTG